MKKKISLILAVLMSVSILSSCSSVDDNKETLPSVETITQAETVTTPTETEITAESVTESTTVQAPFVPEDETTAETTTVPEGTEATTTTEQTTVTEATETTVTEQKWTETASEKKMYVTESCYSRAEAVVGAKSVATYKRGNAVNIVAITSTGYYKLKDGSFIHSDYLTEKAPETTTAPTTTKPVETTTKPSVSNPSGNAGSSYNVDYTTRYAYKQLSGTQQKLYGRLVEGITNLEQMVEVPSGLSKSEIIEVYCLVFNQEPQLFWMSSVVPSGTKYLMLSYKVDDPDEIASMQAQIDRNTKYIMSKVNNVSGTFAKLKVMFDWIVKDAEFSKEAGGYNSTIYNGLGSGGDLQCAGYAKSMKYLCDLAGIPCMVIVGTNADGASHAWNVVYCDNGYYNLDSTWADPVNSFDSDYIQYEFFLVPDSWIHNKTHFNVNKKIEGTKINFFTPPACTQTSNNYFKVYNKLYSSEDSAVKAFKSELNKAIANGSNVATIRVTDKAIYDKLMSDSYAKTFNSYAKNQSSSVKGLAKQSKISFGTQVVHYNIVYK